MIKKTTIQSTLSDTENLLEYWKRFRVCFRKTFDTDAVSKKDEQLFLEVKSGVAKFQRLVNQKIDRSMKTLTDQIQSLLRQSISISHLRAIPESDQKKLFVIIHEVYVNILTLVGAYRFMLEGYQPHHKTYKPTQGDKFKQLLANKNLWIFVSVGIVAYIAYIFYTNL